MATLFVNMNIQPNTILICPTESYIVTLRAQADALEQYVREHPSEFYHLLVNTPDTAQILTSETPSPEFLGVDIRAFIEQQYALYLEQLSGLPQS